LKINAAIAADAFYRLHNDKYTKLSPCEKFRVDALVTQRTPHSAGREGLPHPVPRF
jgi:hypothetical protein